MQPDEQMPAIAVLHSNRLIIRRFMRGDISESYLGWLNDPSVTRFSNQRFKQHDLASATSYLESFRAGPSLFLSLCLGETGRPVGTMTVHVAWHHKTADLGILLGDREVWGKGFGLEAWRCVMHWLFNEAGMRKITAGAAAANLAMIAIMQRSQMKLEGTRRAQEIIDGKPVDILLFGRLIGD